MSDPDFAKVLGLSVAVVLAGASCKTMGSFEMGSGGAGGTASQPNGDTSGGSTTGMGGPNTGAVELWAGAGGSCKGELENPFGDMHAMKGPPVTPYTEIIAYVGDVDGDKDLDVITSLDSGESGSDLAGWYENKGGNKFSYHRISQGGSTNTKIYVADMDGDGDVDVVHGTGDWGDQQPGGLAIYENRGRSWKQHWLLKGEDIDRVWAGDIDGDKAMDVVFERDEKLYWMANEKQNGSKWSKARPFGDFNGVRLTSAHDFDRDGDDDFIYYVPDNEIGWLENNNKGQSWKQHRLGTDLSHRYATMAQSIEPVDFDGDGDIDIIAGNGSYVGGVHVFINADGKGTFAPSKLLERDNYNQAGHVIAADVNGDKRIDVLAGSEHSNGVHTFSYDPAAQACGKATAFKDRIERIISMRAGDFDKDGDLDLVVAKAGYGLVYLENTTR